MQQNYTSRTISSKNKDRLNEVIHRNLNADSFKSMSKCRYNNYTAMNDYDNSYEELNSIKLDSNHTAPMPIPPGYVPFDPRSGMKNPKINEITSNWTTGIKKINEFQDSLQNQSEDRYFINTAASEVTLNKLIKRIVHLEHRMNATDDKIRVSEQILDLKYNEKILNSQLCMFCIFI